MSSKSKLSLHETANLIGQWFFGDEWSEALLQERGNELHKRVREAIRELIASEEVKVSYNIVDHQADHRTHLIKFEDTQHCPSSYKMGHQSGLSIGGSGSVV